MTGASTPETGFALVDGVRLYYEALGQGEPLILLHGGGLNCRMWDEQFEVFARHYRVIRYDARGSGKSDMPTAGESYSHSEDLYALLQFLGLKQVYLMGLSLGGRISIDFALEHPEMVKALVLVAAGMSGYEFADLPAYAEVWKAFDAGNMAQAAEIMTQIWADGPNRTPDQMDARVRERVVQMNLDTFSRPQPQPRAEWREAEPPAISRLPEIQAPTFILVGDQDQQDILVIADLLKRQLAQAELVVIPGVAHMVSMEQPEHLNQLTLDFLAKQRLTNPML
jgi:3-oxoadipate enol-lactonase